MTLLSLHLNDQEFCCVISVQLIHTKVWVVGSLLRPSPTHFSSFATFFLCNNIFTLSYAFISQPLPVIYIHMDSLLTYQVLNILITDILHF